MAYNPYFNNYYQPQGYYPNNGAMPDMLNQYKGQQFNPQMVQQPQQQTQPIPAPSSPNNDIIWVQGEAGAKAYLVAPNNTVTLWDSENQTIYVKSADASGLPSMRILDWQERTQEATRQPQTHECKCGSKFVPIDDFNALKERLNALAARIDAITGNKPETEENNG